MAAMPRYKLTIEYDGTPFVGWQVQDNGSSVQGVLTDAVAGFAGDAPRSTAPAALTPACMPLGQVAHVDLAMDWDAGDRARRAQRAFAPASGRGARGRTRLPTPSRRASPQSSGITCTASSTAAPTSRSIRTAPGASRARSISARCTRRPSASSASTISRRSVRPSAQGQIAGQDASTGSTSRGTATISASSPQHHDLSCTMRSARWSVRWSMSAKANGAPTIYSAALFARDRTRCGQVAPPPGLYLVRVEY